MSIDPQQPVPDTAATRPTTVTLAGICQFAIAVLSVATAGVALWLSAKLIAAAQEAVRQQDLGGDIDPAAVLGIVKVVLYGSVVAATLPAVLLALFAVFHMGGRNWARIVSWVLAGFGICCGVLAVPLGGGGDGVSSTTGNDETSRAIQDAMVSVDVPGWLDPVRTVVTVVTVLLYLAVIVLLALPQSNAWFKARQAERVHEG
jgi:hypothetical protein